MQRPTINRLLNLADLQTKRELLATIGTLTGLYEIHIEPRRDTRTTRQNRYYFGALVNPFVTFLREQGQPVPTLEAHGVMKRRFLPLDLVNPLTGEVIDTIADSSHDKDIQIFGAYIDQCSHWLTDTFGIIVQTPEQYAPHIPAQPAGKPEDF